MGDGGMKMGKQKIPTTITQEAEQMAPMRGGGG
jgi:hypothetical protein